MDPRKHDLFGPILRKSRDLLPDLLRPPAVYPASCYWDNAITAKLIAAVLDLDVGSRMIVKLPQLSARLLWLFGYSLIARVSFKLPCNSLFIFIFCCQKTFYFTINILGILNIFLYDLYDIFFLFISSLGFSV